MSRISLILTGIFAYLFCGAQNSPADSLNTILAHAKDDTTRAQTYILLTEIYAASNLDTVIPLCEKALVLAEKGLTSENAKVQRASRVVKVSAYNNIGYVYSMKDEIVRALEYYALSKAELDTLGDQQGLANYYISVGYVYNNQGDVARALDNYQKSYEIQNAIGDVHGAASSLNNMAVIYNRLGDSIKALEYFANALKMYQRAGEKIGEATALNNMASIYERMNDTATSLDHYRRSLAIRKEVQDVRGVGSTLTNMGVLFDKHGQPQTALKYYHEALPIRESAKDKKGVALTLVNIATTHSKLQNQDSALYYGERSLALSRQIKYPEAIASSSRLLSDVYAATGNYKLAYEMQVLFKRMSDTISNDATKKAAFKTQMKYNIDQHEAQLKAQQDLKDSQAEEARQKQNIIIYGVSAGLLLMIVLSLFIWRGYRQKQQANEIILAQKAETERAKMIIEEKNKDILDSLNYARRIQRAKLPDPDDILKILPESFVLFQPKDIVSGDFYFFGQHGKYIFLAAADCTGHGVPGAMMSMIGYEKLSEAIGLSDDVSRILKLVNQGIRFSLRQNESEDSTRDGMDIALCRIDLQTNTVQYAGANRPLWCIRRGENDVHEIKPTKKALGGLTANDEEFARHEFTLDDGDTLYLFSDGYADLFNGETGKKLTTKKFRQLLLDIREHDLHTQEVLLSDFALQWRKGTEQVDDILVIGMRL